MYGSDIGTLSVSAMNTILNSRINLFKKQGNQGEKWFKKTIQLPTGQYQVYVFLYFHILCSI